MSINNLPLNPLPDVPRPPDIRCPLQDNSLEVGEMFAVLSSSLHAFQLFNQRINEDSTNSPRQDVVALMQKLNYLPPVGLPQLVIGNAAVKLCSIVVMDRSTVHCL